MSSLSILLGFLFLFTSLHFGGSREQQEAQKYLRNVIERSAGIRDYVVDVKVHLDMEAVKAPDMEARIYYKEPDKVKIDSKGLFFLPKEVGVFNPRRFNPEEFDADILDTLNYDGDPAVRVSLQPKKDEERAHKIVLTIDKKVWLMKEIATVPYPGRQADAKIKYGSFDGFMLPVEIDVNLDLQKVDEQAQSFGNQRRRMNEVRGSVTLYYSNYKINTGLSDSIFVKSGSN